MLWNWTFGNVFQNWKSFLILPLDDAFHANIYKIPTQID